MGGSYTTLDIAQTLRVQYRMHPDIFKFPNTELYKGRIADGDNVLRHQKSWHANELFGPLVFFDVRGTEMQNEKSFSIHNPMEVDVVEKLIRVLHASYPKERFELGVISGYKAQVNNLETRLHEIAKSNKLFKINEENISADHIHIKVKSLDGFQGQEKGILILSAVRSNDIGALGFLNNRKRVNVALTRSKYSLWIVGNASTLSRSNLWKRLLNAVKNRGKIIDCGNLDHFNDSALSQRAPAIAKGKKKNEESKDRIEEAPIVGSIAQLEKPTNGPRVDNPTQTSKIPKKKNRNKKNVRAKGVETAIRSQPKSINEEVSKSIPKQEKREMDPVSCFFLSDIFDFEFDGSF